MTKLYFVFAIIAIAIVTCSYININSKMDIKKEPQDALATDSLETIIVGAGCFWCVEAVFDELQGVTKVESGYAGGDIVNPTYKQICDGNTGHAEVIKITFNPTIISLADLLRVFFHTHDPTTLNRQGYDSGTQYRSCIFYENDTHKATAEAIKAEAQLDWEDSIVTEITAFSNYYPAEDYHQEYYKLNGSYPYCRAVIDPKMAKFRKEYKGLLKK